MKKVLTMILATSMILGLFIVPVAAAEQTTYQPLDAYELKNGSTAWSFQRALIGNDEYEDLEYIENGWYYEFWHNWTGGTIPYGYKSNGSIISFQPGRVADAVLTFTAPRKGNIQIPSFEAKRCEEIGDGQLFQILKNDLIVFPTDSDWYELTSGGIESVDVPAIFMTVNEGDTIRIRVNMNENQHNDLFEIKNYQIKYVSVEAYELGSQKENTIVVNKTPLTDVDATDDNKEPAPTEKIEVNFTDITNHWGKDYIIPLAEQGIIKGKSETTFEPDANITRAEFLTLALNVGKIEAVAGESYADVASDAWFTNTIATAKSLNLIDTNMTADGNFYPDQNITREEMTTVIVKLYESKKATAQAGDSSAFSDHESFSAWTTDYIGKAVALGVVTGNPDGTFNALGNATRAEAAVMFSRLLALL